MAVGPLLGSSLILCLMAAGLWFSFASWRERELRAALRGGLAFASGSLIFGLILMAPGFLRNPLLTGLAVLAAPVGAWILLSGRPRKVLSPHNPLERVDERDVLFARFDLEKGSRHYHEYYLRRPEFQRIDDEIRRLPDLLSETHFATAPVLQALAAAEFAFLENQLTGVDGPVDSRRGMNDPAANTHWIKTTLDYLGADLYGICELDQAFVYSHVGRGPDAYGKPIELTHAYAVALAVEMDVAMIASAPRPPVIVETGKQYVAAARIASIAAATIRRLGYPARAHMAGSNYRAMLPPLAWKAGLGEVGRIGILLTERFGPRIRLGLVTTDLPLLPDQPQSFGVLDFCLRCRKCAWNCPAQAIPEGDRRMENGVLRWVIDREACYRYWRKVGSDCARCIFVCPYSKPDTKLHGLIRRGCARSSAFQWMAVQGDDLFYGRRPISRPPPFGA